MHVSFKRYQRCTPFSKRKQKQKYARIPSLYSLKETSIGRGTTRRRYTFFSFGITDTGKEQYAIKKLKKEEILPMRSQAAHTAKRKAQQKNKRYLLYFSKSLKLLFLLRKNRGLTRFTPALTSIKPKSSRARSSIKREIRAGDSINKAIKRTLICITAQFLNKLNCS